MPHIDQVAALLDQLDDVIAALCLYDARHFLRVIEAKGDVGKLRLQLCTTDKADLTTPEGSLIVLRVKASQGLEVGLPAIDLLCEVDQSLLHCINLLDRDLGLQG